MMFCDYCGCGISGPYCEHCSKIKLGLERAKDDLTDSLRFTAAGSDAKKVITRRIKQIESDIIKINEAYRNRRLAWV